MQDAIYRLAAGNASGTKALRDLAKINGYVSHPVHASITLRREGVSPAAVFESCFLPEAPSTS